MNTNPLTIEAPTQKPDVLKNYFLVALRNGRRNKIFVVLSTMSLAIALGSVLLVAMYAKQEFSYDQFHHRAGDIYRLVTHSQNQETERQVGFVPLALAPHLHEHFPSIEHVARVWVYRRAMPIAQLERNVSFYEERFAWAESTFFDLFDYSIVDGNRIDPLGKLHSVVLSETMAHKYFGETDPIGQMLHFRAETDIPLEVTAVMADFPANSHMQFDFVANIQTAEQFFWAGGNGQGLLEDWVNLFVPAYVLVRPGTALEPILAEATRQVNQHLNVPNTIYTIEAQPLTDIHLTSRLDVGEFGVNGSLKNVYAVLGIGLIILVLGCFNFVNLTTAQAGQRIKEVGLRKVLGGTRAQVLGQHYFEVVLLVGLALVVVLAGVPLLLPALRPFLQPEQALNLLNEPVFIGTLIGFFIGVVLAAGAYPALFISRFAPVLIFKDVPGHPLGGSSLRNVLVTAQFAMSAALIVCTIVVYQQLQFMQEKELGFASEQMVVIPIHNDSAIIPNFQSLKQAYEQYSNVLGVTASSHLPLATYTYQNSFRLAGRDHDYRWERYTVEGDFPEVYGLDLVAGRTFRLNVPADTNAVLLNQQAIRELGLTPAEAIGQRLENRSMGLAGEIIGVVRDFHYQSLHESIQPFVLINQPDVVDYISVRITSTQASETLDWLERVWKATIPTATFGYYFLDDTFGTAYVQEKNLSVLVLSLSLIAVFLACLGLFGLSLFAAERRTKEIGVRKVLGASVASIVVLLSRDLLKFIALAFVIAVPMAYVAMQGWLSNFAYRIDMSWAIFLLAGLVALGIAWLTVSYHAIRAALADPVRSLRYE